MNQDEITPEFDAICVWIGQSNRDYMTGSDQWCHELRSQISAVKNLITETELDSLNHTLATMRANYSRTRVW